MRGTVLFAVLFFACMWVWAGCNPHGRAAGIRRIGIQPIGFTDTQQLHFVRQQLTSFFRCPVYIFRPVSMPPSGLDHTKGERYSADTVLSWLSGRRDDSVSILVGLTRKDIFITRRDRQGRIMEPAARYAAWGILGLGYCPGKMCVVSDARFYASAPDKYEHRLRTLLLHEIGHNLGLPHCSSPRCIMNDANEQIATVDGGGDDYCLECKRRLHQ